MEDCYVALDLETTGLSAKKDRIIEIGAVSVENGEIRSTFSTLVNPRRQLPDCVVKMTGITQKSVDRAPQIEEILTDLSVFIGDRVLLGHQILFDYSFLKRAYVNAGKTFEKRGIDTLKLSRKYLKDLPSKRLPDLCRYYGIPQRAHRALEDALAAHYLYQKLKEDFYGNGSFAARSDCGEENCVECVEKDFSPRTLVYKVKKESPAGKRQIERLLSLLARHKLSIPIEVDSMSKNEVSRLTDQIVAKYGR